MHSNLFLFENKECTLDGCTASMLRNVKQQQHAAKHTTSIVARNHIRMGRLASSQNLSLRGTVYLTSSEMGTSSCVHQLHKESQRHNRKIHCSTIQEIDYHYQMTLYLLFQSCLCIGWNRNILSRTVSIQGVDFSVDWYSLPKIIMLNIIDFSPFV